RRGRGAPKQWTPQLYCRLLRDEARVRRDHPTFSNENVYRTIIKRGDYKRKNGKPLGPGRIKSALREARDPQCNLHLAAYVSNMMSKIRSEHERGGWSSDIEAEVTRLCIKKYDRFPTPALANLFLDTYCIRVFEKADLRPDAVYKAVLTGK